MKRIILPDIGNPSEHWVIRPVWLLDEARLHCVAWIAPEDVEPSPVRYFIVDGKICEFSGRDDAASAVICGSGAIGLVRAPNPASLCPRCCVALHAIAKAGAWSSELAKHNIGEVRKTAVENGDIAIDWALLHIDTSDPAKCDKMLQEIVKRAPNSGTYPFDSDWEPGMVHVFVDADEWLLDGIEMAHSRVMKSRCDAARKRSDTRRRNRPVMVSGANQSKQISLLDMG